MCVPTTRPSPNKTQHMTTKNKRNHHATRDKQLSASEASMQFSCVCTPSDPHTQLSAISLYPMILAPSWFTYSVRYSPTSEKNRGDVISAQYSSPYARVHRVSSLIVITVVKYHRNRIYVQAFHRLKCESKRDWMSKAESSRFKAT